MKAGPLAPLGKNRMPGPDGGNGLPSARRTPSFCHSAKLARLCMVSKPFGTLTSKPQGRPCFQFPLCR